MREINEIHIHCADTPSDMDVTAAKIRSWHVSPPRNWSDIGYHWVIKNDGAIELGRPLQIKPASIYGHNRGAVAICLAGGRAGRGNPQLFRSDQFDSLEKLIIMLKEMFPITSIKGHSEYDKNKTCPNFRVQEWLNKRGLNGDI